MSKILIVDDDLASCRTLQLHLRSQKHEVLVAHSVDDGLEILPYTSHGNVSGLKKALQTPFFIADPLNQRGLI